MEGRGRHPLVLEETRLGHTWGLGTGWCGKEQVGSHGGRGGRAGNIEF